MKKLIFSIILGILIGLVGFFLLGKHMIDFKKYKEYTSYSEETMTVVAFGKNMDEITIYAKKENNEILGSLVKCPANDYVVGKKYEFIILDNTGIMFKECVNSLNSSLFEKAKQKYEKSR